MSCQYLQAVTKDSVSTHLILALKSARSQSALVKGNIFFPDSTMINKNRVDPNNVKDKNTLKNAQQWLMNFLIPSSCYNIDSLLFLTNMSNGDDWIIKRGWNHGIMFQLIDAREITLLIQKTIDISDSTQTVKKLTM